MVTIEIGNTTLTEYGTSRVEITVKGAPNKGAVKDYLRSCAEGLGGVEEPAIVGHEGSYTLLVKKDRDPEKVAKALLKRVNQDLAEYEESFMEAPAGLAGMSVYGETDNRQPDHVDLRSL